MKILIFSIVTMIQLYTTILVMRIWMQLVKIDFYNPLSQLIIKITKIVIDPVNKLIPNINRIDTTALFVSYILTLINTLFLIIITNNLSFVKITILPICLIQILVYSGKLIFWSILMRTLLSWTNNKNSQIYNVLIQLTEPLMLPVRKIIPLISGLDFSSVFLMLTLLLLNKIRFNILFCIDSNIANLLRSFKYLI